MRLPKLDPDKDYQGLYVIDFGPCGEAVGETVAVGYTAEEVAIVLESERYAQARVYKIHRLQADGTVELRGVSRRRFDVESAFCFCSRTSEQAEKDFARLKALAEQWPLPCKARLLWGELGYQPRFPWVVALLYPAEYEDELSAWLIERDYQGGQCAEGGISHATNVAANLRVRQRAQLPCAAWRQSRAPEEVLRAVGQTIQR